MIGVVSPYHYALPADRIAQRPLHPPDSARMLVADRRSGTIRDFTFHDLPAILSEGYHFVFNDTRVIPARLFGQIVGTGAEIELLLVHRVSSEPETNSVTWLCIGKPLKRIRKAKKITFRDDLFCTVEDTSILEQVSVRFETPAPVPIEDLLNQVGCMPIPPYIRDGHGDDHDKNDYQTIFAERPGSVAAPTASLHFTPDLVRRIEQGGNRLSFLTLHVGTASFQPVIMQGKMRSPAAEELIIPSETQAALQSSKAAGRKIVGVGTTVTRALESAALGTSEGTTDLFITPGHTFRGIDSLVTNFHQPGTTHLLLVEAFVGRPFLEEIYQHGLRSGYRFLSYGDGMVIL